MAETLAPRFDDVSIRRLHFDPDNPRFPASLDGGNEQAILRFMLEDAGLIDLMRSIASQGFFPGEPVLVSPRTGSEDHWTVIEGNRRLAAAKLLADPSTAPTRKQTVANVADDVVLKTLPCLKFPTRAEILKHLGYRHVTGIKEWEPLAKARFLRQRFDSASGSTTERFQQLARSIGSRSDYVGRLITALETYNEIARRGFYNIPSLNERTIEFSLISSILGYTNIVEYLGLNSSQDMEAADRSPEHLEHITRWVFEREPGGRTRLKESRNIRVLADVVADEEAVSALVQGASLEQAARIAGGAESLDSYLGAARENLELALETLPDLKVKRTDVDSADDVRKLALRLRIGLQGRLDESEE